MNALLAGTHRRRDAGPPPGVTTKFGVSHNGFAATYSFEAAAGFLSENMRIYGGFANGNPADPNSNKTAESSRARNARDHPTAPGYGLDTSQYISCRFAEVPATTDATLIAWLDTVGEIAADYAAVGTPYYMSMNPEPDRTDRPYTLSQFLTMHERWSTLAATHAPDATITLNLTGYLFANRIDNYWPALEGQFTVLSVDPYWEDSSSGVQAGEDHLQDACDFAGANNLTVGLGEWGIEVGINRPPYGNQGGWVAHAVEFIAGLGVVEFAPYFESDGPIDGRLQMNGFADEYGAAVNAL